MRLDLSIADLEHMQSGMNEVVRQADMALDKERRRRSPSDDQREYRDSLPGRIAQAKALSEKLSAAVEACKRLVAIDVEIRPPDSTHTQRGRFMTPAHRLALTVEELDEVTHGLSLRVGDLQASLNRRRGSSGAMEWLQERWEGEARNLLGRMLDFTDALKSLPVATVEVATAEAGVAQSGLEDNAGEEPRTLEPPPAPPGPPIKPTYPRTKPRP